MIRKNRSFAKLSTPNIGKLISCILDSLQGRFHFLFVIRILAYMLPHNDLIILVNSYLPIVGVLEVPFLPWSIQLKNGCGIIKSSGRLN